MYQSDSNRGSSLYGEQYAPPSDPPTAPASYPNPSPDHPQMPVTPVYPIVPGNTMPYYYTLPNPVPVNQGQGKAIASLVLGIICIVFSTSFFIGLPCAVVGLVLGILAKRQRAGGMATAGIVLSGIGLFLSLIIVVIMAVLFIEMYESIQEIPYIEPYGLPYQQAFWACILK